MAYSDNFPATRPVFQADFANGGKIDPRATFSRSDTPPTYAAPSAVHYWSNEKHLSSENLLPHSNDLSTWTSSSTTAPSTNNTAPDGTSTATEVAENTANSSHNRYKSFPATTGTNYTYLVFAKANGRTQFRIAPQATAVIASVKFDLTAVTASVISGSTVGTPSITAIGSTGWYRCELTVTATGSGNGYHQLDILDASGNGTYTGDGSSGFYFWGAQVSSTGETVLNETSGQIARSYAPTLKSVATAGQPRFEYDPSTDGQSAGTSRGILIESQSTNLFNYSEEFQNGYWTTSDVTRSTNVAIAPNGALAADMIVADSTGSAGIHYLGKSYPFTSGNTYTFSVYVKGVNSTEFTLQGGNTSTYAAATQFTLTGAGSASVNTGSATIESVGNGWYRCSVTGTALATASTNTMFKLISGGTGTYDGDDYSGVLLWGAQLEEASFPSSYLKVEGSTATRAADSLSVATADIGYTGGPVTVVGEASFLSDDASAPGGYDERLFRLHKDSSNYAQSFRLASDDTIRTQVVSDGGVVATFANASTDTAANTFYKFASRIDTNNFGATLDGAAPATDSAGQLPDLNGATLYIGKSITAGELNGHCKRVAIYNEALSDSNLQAITS